MCVYIYTYVEAELTLRYVYYKGLGTQQPAPRLRFISLLVSL